VGREHADTHGLRWRHERAARSRLHHPARGKPLKPPLSGVDFRAATTSIHYQTIQGLGERLGLPVTSPFAQGQEEQLADSLVSSQSGVVLICWEHKHIPVIASGPRAAGTFTAKLTRMPNLPITGLKRH
jgi:hypothetical protein